jgi:hypothetical protein
MFTLPMAEMQPHGIVDAKCAPKERQDRKNKNDANLERSFVSHKAPVIKQGRWRERVRDRRFYTRNDERAVAREPKAACINKPSKARASEKPEVLHSR